MKKSLLFFLFLPLLATAQIIKVKGVIKNIETKEVIPYVNIGIKENAIGTGLGLGAGIGMGMALPNMIQQSMNPQNNESVSD